ncbi:GNAT family N-acetyltransferase [Microvirga sp. 2MCAF35]|uniref:GNAT family N-acetyltransferase n=1 Tax=Microvirga sp. 2MCAF35 TaxID=3232987 RepID=UPI003F967FFA
MKVVVVPGGELPADLVTRWGQHQESSPLLFSPFFRPEFTQAVAKVRRDVFVGVIDGGSAFLPFQRNFLGSGQPVGGPVSDYHGFIAAPEFRCDMVAVMRGCGLRTWGFNHVLAQQTMFAPWRVIDTDSPIVDLDQHEAPGSTALYADHRRKRRRLEREVGPIEVELQSTDPSMLHFCLEWKSAHYRRIGAPDLFSRPWARALIDVVASHRSPEFSGMLSVLRAGGQPIAAHFGLRSGNVWHYWFPTYNPQFQRYSPGILLLLDMMAGAKELGMSRIDFGRGDNDYKLRIANQRVPLIEGTVVTNPFIWQCRSRIAQLVKAAPAVKSLLKPAHRIFKEMDRVAKLR